MLHADFWTFAWALSFSEKLYICFFISITKCKNIVKWFYAGLQQMQLEESQEQCQKIPILHKKTLNIW